MRLIHLGLYQICSHTIVKLAYTYHGGDEAVYSHKAQIIAFTLMANLREKWWNMALYNDQLMNFYIVLAIYFMVQNKPFIATLLFSLSYSIKSAAVLLLPSFLGMIQHNNGARVLILALILIVAF